MPAADIEKVDLSQQLSSDTVDAIKQAWAEHLVLRFRGQRLNDDRLMQFSAHFGELDRGSDLCRLRDAARRVAATGQGAALSARLNLQQRRRAAARVQRGDRPAAGAGRPIIRTHPVTGRKALFLGCRRDAYIQGLELEESERLLDALWAHATRPELTLYQQWRVGNLVLWDNCVLHRRDEFDPNSRRLMHRSQIKGERPY